MNLYPTPYLRWIRRDTAGPTRVLQQWHGEPSAFQVPPGAPGWTGEWRDVPTVEPGADTAEPNPMEPR